ncbi:uncharacterized protein METZ01_LOCUS330937 [marine metagenome]|uniref:Uncharacterized protein n=1 Tax=marine metagenome TaxID=408172 RepID=A0A382PXJ0_9ZZZZ
MGFCFIFNVLSLVYVLVFYNTEMGIDGYEYYIYVC